jgi:hypothetical protein
MSFRLILLLSLCCVGSNVFGQAPAPVCLDPLAWTCAQEYGQNVDNPGGCGANGNCANIGDLLICNETSPREAGSGFNGAFTSGTEPVPGNGNGKEVTGGNYIVCVWEYECWEECKVLQGGGAVCNGDWLPIIPYGGFDISFGNDCPTP